MSEPAALKNFFQSADYKSQLKDPRWEKFRADYVSRHGAYCRSCSRAGVTVQVHHLVYERSKFLWEHDDEDLAMLCKECHERWHNLSRTLRRLIGNMKASELQMFVGSISILLKVHPTRDFCFALAQFASEPATVRRLSRMWETQK